MAKNYLEEKGKTITTRYYSNEESRDDFYDKKKKEKNSFLRAGVDAKMSYDGYGYFVTYDNNKNKTEKLYGDEFPSRYQ